MSWSRKRKEQEREMERLIQAQHDALRGINHWKYGGTPPPMPDHKPPPRKKPEPPPVFSECVIGYRQWKIDALGRLRPITVDARPWTPGINTAECDIDHRGGLAMQVYATFYDDRPRSTKKHKAPNANCDCGIYARFDLTDTMKREAKGDYPPLERIVMPTVVGAIATWGDLQVHADGMRAEKACVVALALSPGMPAEVQAVVKRVAETYRVPAVPLDMLTMEASQHGNPLPDDAKPKRREAEDFNSAYLRILGQQQQRYRQPSPNNYLWSSSSYYTAGP